MSGGNTQFAKSFRTRVAALTTAWSVLAALSKDRTCLIIKNTSASEVVRISTNASELTGTEVPDAADPNYYPLAAGEVLSFDKGLGPIVVFAKGAAGAATVALIES